MGFFFCDFPLFYIRIAYVFFFLIIVKILEFSLLETRTKTDLCFVCATDHTFLASFLVIPKIFSAGFGQPMDLQYCFKSTLCSCIMIQIFGLCFLLLFLVLYSYFTLHGLYFFNYSVFLPPNYLGLLLYLMWSFLKKANSIIFFFIPMFSFFLVAMASSTC